MRRFNPEKELKKIQKGNKNKILYGIIALLLIISIGSTYALYQVRYSKRIIYTKVVDFSKDVNIMAVFVDSAKVDDFPTKNQGKIFDKIVCDNNNDNHVSAYWDYDKWGLVVETTKKAKCNVYFKTSSDTSGANAPELYQGLIPVTFDSNGTIKVADTSKEWYNYDSKEWANAVLVTNDAYQRIVKEDGTYDTSESLSLDDDILQMYVWIPRYKYQLFNAINGEGVDPQEIQIQFESGTSSTGSVICEIDNKGKETCICATNGNWYTHPAFKFGNTDLKGIWVGKFETTGNINAITIKPNITSLSDTKISVMFNASRNIEETYAANFNLNKEEIDTHMMKNMDWGAMAYLTHSKYGRCNGNGKCEEVAVNQRSGYITGYAGTTYTWETPEGQKASTTGNMYGIYDTSGGTWEFTMGVMMNATGSDIEYSSSGFDVVPLPAKKYYDLYEYDTVASSHRRGHLGDATRETLKTFNDLQGGWYDDLSHFLYNIEPWFIRGGDYARDADAGTFVFWGVNGGTYINRSFRIVLTAQDGDE